MERNMQRVKYFQREVEKYENRIKKIEEKPDPKRMRSTKYLYEAWRDHRQGQIDAYLRGELFCYHQGAGQRIILSMGINVLNLAELADQVRPDVSMKYFNEARSWGFPSEVCDWTQVGSGVVLSGDIPEPSFVFTYINDCAVMARQASWVAWMFGVPLYAIDIPMEVSWRALEYVTQQIEDLIAKIEKLVPGANFDEAKLMSMQKINMEIYEYIDDLWKLAESIPSAISAKDGARLTPLEMGEDPKIAVYYRELLKEVGERMERGDYPVPDEKARLMWLALIPNFYDPFSFLGTMDINTPLFENSPGIDSCKLGKANEERYGRELTPLQQEAAWMAGTHWGGLLPRRYGDILRWCKKLKIDGLVHPMMPGCPVTCGGALLIRDKASKDLGIPMLITDGWLQDYEKFNTADFQNKLGEMADMILRRKERQTGKA